MRALLRRILPQSLAGQIILLVAVALFVAQAINFTLLFQERQRQTLIGTTAPAVVRLLDALDRRAQQDGAQLPDFARDRRSRVSFSTTPPVTTGKPRTDVEQRARGMLEDAGIPPITVIARQDNARVPGNRWTEMRARIEQRPPRSGKRLTLAVEYEKGQWATVRTRIENDPPRFGGWLIGQTLILYIIVLAPLLLIGRRLARPLRDLTQSARQFADTGAGDAVTERGPGDVRDLTMAFNAMRARLLAMLEEKDRMLGAIGHDLRTPLASLRVRAESVEDDSERNRIVGTIEEMNRMLDDILSLARAGRSMEPVQKVDLATLADAVVEDFIELGSDVAMQDSARTVLAVRPQLLRRAVRNLIENALKYAGSAMVSVAQVDGEIHINVTDNGPGIAEDRMADMMEPFTRLEESRNRDTGGAGLGLALVRAIMAEHGGDVRLANRPEGGLVATLVLPI